MFNNNIYLMMKKLGKINLRDADNVMSEFEMKRIIGGQYVDTNACGLKAGTTDQCSGKCAPKFNSNGTVTPQTCKGFPDGLTGTYICSCI